MLTALRIALTALAALYLLLVLVALIGMTNWGSGFAVLAYSGMVGNGFMVSDWVGKIWNLNDQYDSEEV